MLTLDTLISVLSALVGTFGFGVLFHMKGKKLLFASLGGMCAWFLYLLFSALGGREILCYLIISILLSLYSEVMARWLKTPATPFAMMTLIPLVPGGSLYYCMSNAIQGDLEAARVFGGEAAKYALGIAVGISLTWAIIEMVQRLIHMKKEER